MDISGIATLLAAFGALVTSIVGAWVTVSNTRATRQEAIAAASTARETKAQTEATAHMVDGKMAEMTKLVEASALAKGALVEQTAQRDRESAAALALSRGVGAQPVVVPAKKRAPVPAKKRRAR